MPAVGPAPETKRRSRRGCLPCRKRHRKCDEQKPECGNCRARNATCAYKPLTWVSDTRSLRRNAGDRDDGTTPSSFPWPPPQEAPPPVRPYPRPRSDHGPQEGHCYRHLSRGVLEEDTNGPASRPVHTLTPSSSSMPPEGIQIHETLAITTTQRPTFGNSPALDDDLAADSVCGNSLASSHAGTDALTHSRLGDPHELAGILRSFMYDVAPLIDASVPRSSFAGELLELAQTCDDILRATNLVVEARLKYTQRFAEYRQPSHENRRLLVDLSAKDGFTANVGYCLVALERYFGTCPSKWSSIRLQYHRDDSLHLSLQDIKEPLQSLIRFQIKIELADCLLTRAPLSEAALSWVRHYPMSVSDSLPQIVYDASLALLARCIHLVNCKPSIYSTHRGLPSGEPPEPVDFKSAWSAHWALCTHWYETRPREMVPIFETTSLEADALETEDDAGFPVSIHTSPISLQANMNMHMTCLLLIRHRPGLMALSTPQHQLESRSWHAEKIAGSAIWNNYKEQWDPLFLAALLSIAEEMTHRFQQHALRDCLQRISQEVGIDLQHKMATLNQLWHSFQEDVDIDFDY